MPEIKNSNLYWWKVNTDLFIKEGILPGDLALVKEGANIKNGDWALVILNGCCTIRRIYKDANGDSKEQQQCIIGRIMKIKRTIERLK